MFKSRSSIIALLIASCFLMACASTETGETVVGIVTSAEHNENCNIVDLDTEVLLVTGEKRMYTLSGCAIHNKIIGTQPAVEDEKQAPDKPVETENTALPFEVGWSIV